MCPVRHIHLGQAAEQILAPPLATPKTSTYQVAFDVSHYLGLLDPEGISSEFMHGELLLSTPGAVEQLQRVLSAPLTRVAKIEHSYNFDDTWQKPSVEWITHLFLTINPEWQSLLMGHDHSFNTH